MDEFKDYPHWLHLELCGDAVFHRRIGEIPGILEAQDVFIEGEERNGRRQLTISNPSKSGYINRYVA